MSDGGELIVRPTGSLAPSGVTSSAAAVAKSEIEAQHAVAAYRPRDLDVVSQHFLLECNRPGLARIARYRIQRGGKSITGPSVRLADVALRCMGNHRCSTVVISDTSEARVVRVIVCDLESNSVVSLDVVVTKTVERKNLREGQLPISQRVNSYGEMVFTVEASDDDFAPKLGAATAKARRNCILQLFPGWLLEEGMAKVDAVLRGEVARDPEAERRTMVDWFATQGIMAKSLVDYLGHAIDQITPDEVVELRDVATALREGEAKWSEVLEQRKAERGITSEPVGLKAKADKAAAERKEQP